jgi:hypothetical protein
MSNNYFNDFNTDNSVEDKVEEVTTETSNIIEETEVVSDPIKSEDVVKETTKKSDSESVVVYALRDLAKPGNVSLVKGYNTISKSQYKKWEGFTVVRLASQEEIEKYVN